MKQGKFLPGLLVIGAILIAIFAIYGFADIHNVELDSPANGTWSSSANVNFNCTAITNATEVEVNITLWLGLISSNALTYNKTNMTAATNDTTINFTVQNIPDGAYYWTCEATNMSFGTPVRNMTNYTVYVDTAAPHTIALNSLSSGTNTSSTTLNFNWTASDAFNAFAATMTCNLTIDSVINKTVTVINGTMANYSITNFADGLHYWNISSCNDSALNKNITGSETRRFTVDALAPETIVSNINNGSWWNSANVNFNWTATNTGTSVLYCNVTVDGEINKTRAVTSGIMANSTVENLADGLHTWYANCSTLLGTWNTTGILSPTQGALWVDTAAPVITLNNSAILVSGTNTTATTIIFNWTATDNVATAFYCNFTFDSVVNNTGIAGNESGILVANDTLENWPIANIPDGNHEWNVTCWDPTNVSSNTVKSASRRLRVDTTAPSNIAPNIANNTNFSSSTVYLNWTTKDATSSVVNCSLVVDGVRNLTGFYSASAAGAAASQAVSGLSEGQHTWHVNCSDYMSSTASANWNSTGSLGHYAGKVRAFYVDVTPPTPLLTLASTSIITRATNTITCSASHTRDTSPSAGFTVRLPDGTYSNDIGDSTFADTIQAGTYTVRCTATDYVGHTAYTESTFTAGGDTSTGGGSGSSSSSSPSISSTLSVAPGEANSAKVSNANIPVSEIVFDVREAASNVRVTVQAFTSAPSGSVAAEGKIYKYLQITKSNLEDANLNSAKISFFVTKAWLTENGLDSSDIELRRYTTQWVSLPTIVKTSDAAKVYFEATTPGFSVFAIGVKEAEEVPAEEAPVEETPVEEAPVEEVPAEEAPVEPAAEKSNTWMFVLLGLVVVGVIVALVVMKRKKK